MLIDLSYLFLTHLASAAYALKKPSKLSVRQGLFLAKKRGVAGEPIADKLARAAFQLDASDRATIEEHRGDHNFV